MKPVSVSTRLLHHWRKFLFAFIILLLTGFGVMGWLVYEKTNAYYKAKLAIADRKFQNLSKTVDIEKLKRSFQSIDSGMERINSFLKAKGLDEGVTPNAGGTEEALALSDINGVTDFYSHYIADAEEKIKFTPLGVPHLGEQTSDFGYRHNPFTGRSVEAHTGIDFRGKVGDPVKATANGKVVFAGVKAGYGNCIIIAHENKFETLFGHLSRILVKEGQQLQAGSTIGLVGSTGRSTGPHLHYEVMRDGKKIDPEQFLKM